MRKIVLVLLWMPLWGGEWTVNTDDFEEIPKYVTSQKVTADGHLFFLDTRNIRVYHLDPEGQVLHVFGSKGKGPGELERVSGMRLSQDETQVYLVEGFKQQVYAFSREGNFLGIPFALERNHPYLFSDQWQAILRTQDPFLNPNQGCSAVLKTPQGLSELANYGPDLHADPYLFSDPKKGNRGFFSPNWRRQVFLTISPDQSLLFIGSNDRLHVRIFALPTGKELGSIQDENLIQPALTDAYIEKFNMVAGRGVDAVNLKDFEHPATQPVLHGFLVDTQNRLWVYLNRPGFTEENHYRIYSQEKGCLGEVVLPRGYLFHADDTYVWYSKSNEMGDTLLVKQGYQLKNVTP